MHFSRSSFWTASGKRFRSSRGRGKWVRWTSECYRAAWLHLMSIDRMASGAPTRHRKLIDKICWMLPQKIVWSFSKRMRSKTTYLLRLISDRGHVKLRGVLEDFLCSCGCKCFFLMWGSFFSNRLCLTSPALMCIALESEAWNPNSTRDGSAQWQSPSYSHAEWKLGPVWAVLWYIESHWRHTTLEVRMTDVMSLITHPISFI